MNFDGKKTIAKPNANTYDIIEALIKITPTAIKQVKPKINDFIFVTGDAYKDALQIAKYIRKNVTYKQDGYDNQNIQLPARMFLDTKKADCKSFSLAFVSLMKAAGHEAGYRFASYRNNKIPTHVYNWILYKNKLFTFDTCVKNFKESKKYTYIKDMDVNYLSGPCDGGIPALYARVMKLPRNQRAAAIQQHKADCPQRSLGEQLQSAGTQLVRGAKKVVLALPRNAFRLLVSLNVRGLATNLNKSIIKDENKVKEFWEKLGGKFDGGDSLKQSIATGKDKKPVFGEANINGCFECDSNEYIGDPTTIAASITAATPILLAVKQLMKDLKIEPEDIQKLISPKEEAAANESGNRFTDGNFIAVDSEKYLTTGFKPSPLLIGGVIGAGVLIYMLTKNKK
jgi:hypothetical protein